MPVVAGAPTHRAVVKAYQGGRHIEKDELVAYEGPPSWQFEPIDPEAAEKWREEVARPAHALTENLRTGAVIRAPASAAELVAEVELRRCRSLPIRIS